MRPRRGEKAMTRAHPGDRQSGFTLLEMLVALVVLGLLVVGLSQGVRAGLALRQAQERHLADTAELDATMRLLRTILTRLPVAADGNRLIAPMGGDGFSGGPDHVSFVGDLPTGLGPIRRAEMTLHLRNRQLVLSWAPHRHVYSPAAPPPTDAVLLHGVARLELAYWGAAVPGEETGWQERWDGSAAPDLIRVRLNFDKGDLRRWPDLIAAPRS